MSFKGVIPLTAFCYYDIIASIKTKNMTAKTNVVEVRGRVTELLPGAKFRVELEDNNLEIIAHLSGKMRKNSIRVSIGDDVKVEMSPYDLSKGRITTRL